MDQQQNDAWLDDALGRHQRLTNVVVPLVQSLLKDAGIPFLTVTGRTKERASALEKIERKGYKSPETQLTDLSGIRIIVYFESDTERVSKLIESAFYVDALNSLNRDALLSVDQTGYRSVHFVCDLGEARSALPEFGGLRGLKFEFQVRTVLQHAWAELAHDSGYKFSAKLPRDMERKLYLYAGMLEIADKGFDELARQIDAYVDQMAKHGPVQTNPIDSLSLQEFVRQWCASEGFPLEEHKSSKEVGELVSELQQFGVSDLQQLRGIIPRDFAKRARKIGYKTNIYGLVRDWMILRDWEKLVNDVSYKWGINPDEEVGGMIREHYGDDATAVIHAINSVGWER